MSAVQLVLHPLQMGDDRRVPRLDVGCLKDGFQRVQRLAQVTEPADDLRGRNLARVIVPVTAVGVDRGRREQAEIVIVPQRLHAQKRHPREVADAQYRCHSDNDGPSHHGRVN